MWLFCISLLPICFLLSRILSSNSGAYPHTGSAFSFVLGIVLGAFYCVAAMLIFTVNPYIQYNVLITFAKNILFLTVPPCSILFLLLIVFSKNSFSNKVLLFPSLLYGFYSVYVPFTILSYNKVYSFYPLFAEPIVFLLMITAIKIAISLFIAGSAKKMHPLFYVLNALLVLLSLIFPPLMNTFYVLGFSWLYMLLVFCGFALITFLCRLLIQRV